MTRVLLACAASLIAVPGGQGAARPAVAVVVRAPGAAAADSAAVANAVIRALTAAGVEVRERGPDTKPVPGMKSARFIVEVTAKSVGRMGLVDLRLVNAETAQLAGRASLRALTGALADSAAAGAKRLAQKLTAAGGRG
ncbi:MAG TPA: hypothetical protein VG916_00195 [Gemmatimonadaceae bacterium]|nr:hypothetical protein [Gemmatimonadaceae bacterium]